MGDVTAAESIGERIQRLRSVRGFSQNQLEKAIGASQSYISKVEAGKINPSPEVLTKISDVLKVPMKELLQDEEQHLALVTRIKLVEVLLEMNRVGEAEEMIRDLQEHPELSESDGIKLQVHLAECRYKQGKYTESLEILLPLIEELEKRNFHDAWVLAWIRNLIGSNHYSNEDLSNALYNYRKALDYTSRFVEYDALAAKISYNVGTSMRLMGFSLESLTHLQNSFSYFEKMRDKRIVAFNYYQQGIAYKNVKDYEKAVESFNHAKVLFQELNLIKWFSKVQMAISTALTLEKDPPIDQLQECFVLFESERDYPRMILAISRIAEIRIRMKECQEALILLNKIDALVDQFGLLRTPEYAECLRVRALYHFEINEYEESLGFALVSSENFGTMGLRQDQIESLRIVVDTYSAMGDYRNALIYERKRTDLYADLQGERGNMN